MLLLIGFLGSRSPGKTSSRQKEIVLSFSSTSSACLLPLRRVAADGGRDGYEARGHDAVEHVERAQSQGQTVAEYCRQTGLSVHALYSARRQLRDQGLLPGTPKRRPVRKKADKFIAVSVTEAAPVVVCRVRYPGGWVIECASWPDPSWMKELTGERA